jgi:hypothetical protein
MSGIHTYHSHFIPEGLAEASQIFLRDTHFLPNYLAMRNTADVTGGKSIAVRSKKERNTFLLFCPGHHMRHFSLQYK